MEQVQLEGNRKVRREIEYFNLDVIASVGYRVKSNRGIQFRRWANSVVAENATTGSDGKVYITNYYNLDMIIAVGYRVISKRGTQFRRWANSVLKQYLLNGYSLNENIKSYCIVLQGF